MPVTHLPSNRAHDDGPPGSSHPALSKGCWLRSGLLTAAIHWLAVSVALAQSVTVTLKLDTNRLDVGASTTLHVFAQVLPALRPSTDRIFSWDVDLLNPNGAIAALDLPNLKKPSSDQDPRTSSKGLTDGANQRGIYDTFLNLAAAGRDTPVELFSIPVQALSPGRARLSVQPGTGVPQLGADFIVAPTGGGDPLLGGDYSGAVADLEVTGTSTDIHLSILSLPLPNNQGTRLTLSFPTGPGHSYTVETRDGFATNTTWQPLPNGPHNSGTLAATNTLPQRFYRVRID